LKPVNLWLPGHFSPKPRVHRTPGIPCVLFFRGSQAPSLEGRANLKTSGNACRENADAYPPLEWEGERETLNGDPFSDHSENHL
jgi:hypothetical protein